MMKKNEVSVMAFEKRRIEFTKDFQVPDGSLIQKGTRGKIILEMEMEKTTVIEIDKPLRIVKIPFLSNGLETPFKIL